MLLDGSNAHSRLHTKKFREEYFAVALDQDTLLTTADIVEGTTTPIVIIVDDTPAHIRTIKTFAGLAIIKIETHPSLEPATPTTLTPETVETIVIYYIDRETGRYTQTVGIICETDTYSKASNRDYAKTFKFRPDTPAELHSSAIICNTTNQLIGICIEPRITQNEDCYTAISFADGFSKNYSSSYKLDATLQESNNKIIVLTADSTKFLKEEDEIIAINGERPRNLAHAYYLINQNSRSNHSTTPEQQVTLSIRRKSSQELTITEKLLENDGKILTARGLILQTTLLTKQQESNAETLIRKGYKIIGIYPNSAFINLFTSKNAENQHHININDLIVGINNIEIQDFENDWERFETAIENLQQTKQSFSLQITRILPEDQYLESDIQVYRLFGDTSLDLNQPSSRSF